MHAWSESKTNPRTGPFNAPTPGAHHMRLCSSIRPERASIKDAERVAAQAPAGRALRRGRPYTERVHFWSHCIVCGIGDGVLMCETCQGQGIVATKPGGAGVPFYIGNAQCSACKGLGFVPCSVCIGYEAELPPPDPHNGPASHDPSDSQVTTRMWLKSFPDSHSTGRTRRPARKVLPDSPKVLADANQEADTGMAQAKEASWEELAKQFYVMHGAERRSR